MKTSELQCPLCGSHILLLHIPARKLAVQDDRSSAYACSSMGHGNHNDIYYCKACEHGFLHPFPSPQELENLYSDVEDPSYLLEIEGRVHTFSRNIQLLKNFSKGPQLFEVGSYCGIFLNLAQKAGFKVTGLEPSAWARQQASKLYQIQLHSGIYSRDHVGSLGLLSANFDQVVCWDVLEHVEDPKAFMQLAHDMLKQQGIFVFSTVNINSLWTRLLGKRWPWYMQMHLHYFTAKGLNKLLESNGFRVLEVGTYRHVISAQYFGKKLKSITGFPFDRILGHPLFKRWFIPFHFGDIIYIVAEKR